MKLGALAVCRAALRPLIRVLLRHGVMHKEFIELSKEIYVDVARREYGLRGRPTNISRVALLTGLDRKEISRIKNAPEHDEDRDAAHPRQQDRIARLLSGWFQDPDYVDENGKPRVLPVDGPAPSYADLVRRYGGDVPGVTILRELKRTGAVHADDSQVEVLRRNYRLDTADAEALSRAGSVLGDLGQTVTHNLYRDGRQLSRFEARATNASIPRTAIPAYRELIYGEAQSFLEKIDAWLTEHEATDPESLPVERLGVGVYWIQSDKATSTTQ